MPFLGLSLGSFGAVAGPWTLGRSPSLGAHLGRNWLDWRGERFPVAREDFQDRFELFKAQMGNQKERKKAFGVTSSHDLQRSE